MISNSDLHVLLLYMLLICVMASLHLHTFCLLLAIPCNHFSRMILLYLAVLIWIGCFYIGSYPTSCRRIEIHINLYMVIHSLYMATTISSISSLVLPDRFLFSFIFGHSRTVTPQLVPAVSGPLRPSMAANFAAIDGPPGTKYGCHR